MTQFKLISLANYLPIETLRDIFKRSSQDTKKKILIEECFLCKITGKPLNSPFLYKQTFKRNLNTFEPGWSLNKAETITTVSKEAQNKHINSSFLNHEHYVENLSLKYLIENLDHFLESLEKEGTPFTWLSQHLTCLFTQECFKDPIIPETKTPSISYEKDAFKSYFDNAPKEDPLRNQLIFSVDPVSQHGTITMYSNQNLWVFLCFIQDLYPEEYKNYQDQLK